MCLIKLQRLVSLTLLVCFFFLPPTSLKATFQVLFVDLYSRVKAVLLFSYLSISSPCLVLVTPLNHTEESIYYFSLTSDISRGCCVFVVSGSTFVPLPCKTEACSLCFSSGCCLLQGWVTKSKELLFLFRNVGTRHPSQQPVIQSSSQLFCSFLEPAHMQLSVVCPPHILSIILLPSLSALFFFTRCLHPCMFVPHACLSLTSFPPLVRSFPASGRGALGAAADAQGQHFLGGNEAGQHPARVPRGDLHLRGGTRGFRER